MNKYDYFSKNLIEITNFDKNRGTVFYKLHEKIDSHLKIIIADKHNGFIIHQESLGIFPPNIEYYTDFSIFKKYIHQDILVIFKSNDEFFLIETLRLYDEPNFNAYSNFKFNFDVDFCSYYEIFEKEMYKNFSIDVEEDDVVVDIGSNVGAFIKYANDKKAKIIYSCEPNPACIKIIEKHYALNNVVLNKYAISDKNGISELEIPFNSDTSGCSKITEANIKNTFTDVKTIQIKTITFKDFIEKNKISKIDYLKVDCEGGEAFIFKDENKIFFQQNVKKIVLEFHNQSKFDIIKLLESINYSVNIINIHENAGMIYAKNKNLEMENVKSNLKIGVLFASYNCADHIDRCFQPWLNLREELNLVLASTNGRYDLSDLKFDYKGNDSLIKLLGKNLDFLVHSTSVNHRWSEEQSRTYMLNYMLDRKVDLIFVIDADEFYTEEQIRNILKYIKENPNYDAYNVQFKNYVIKLPYWIEGFNKSVIYWCDRHSGIKCFNFDCEIAYNDGTIIQKNTNVNIIPKNIAFVEHYSWLENDPRTKEKTVLQNVKYFGEENLKCSFCYDENNNLIVNENFYKKRVGLLPTFHKTITKHCCDFDIYINENDNSFHIKNVLVNKSFIFSIYNGETNDLIYAPLMNLSANLNYYINCGINLKDYKSFKIIVIDVETNKEIHDELLFLKI
jgi:FkbM family methyltransferase